MNVKNVEKKENNTAELSVEISAQEFDAAVNKVYAKVKGQITLPGFRKGKAPRKLVERMYGADVFYEDAMEELYPAIMEEITKDKSLEIVGYPQTNVQTIGAEGVSLTVTVGLMPVATLGQYKEIPAPRAEVTVSDEEVDAALQPYISRATTQVAVDRPAQMGDTTVIDFEGFVDGVAFEGGKGENHELKLGSGSFIPGFEDQLVGVSAGEDKDVVVTFPEEYQAKELAGKEATFKCTVHEVREEQAPTLDDEFAKDVSEFETLDEFKADLKAKKLEEKNKNADEAFHQSVMTAVVNNAQMEIPDTMVEYETDKMMENYESRIQSMGITLDNYLNMMGTNQTEFRVSIKASALRQIQQELVLKAIVEAEGIEATEEEINAHVAELSEEYGMEEDKIREALNNETLARDVQLKKASELVFASAVPTAPVEETAAEEEAPAEAESADAE
ncbi:MAG: trigger factor [Clostridiales bacterium]|nr:trigger factor [Clostridiales bacterium]